MDENNLEIPVLVTFFTNSRILCTKEFGSYAHFGSVLSYFNKYIKRKGQTKLKKKYVLNNKIIEDNDLLINIIQSINKNKKIIEANLSIEIEEKIINISDNNFVWFSKILQPKLKPFGIFIFNPKDYSINLKQFPDAIIKEYELNKINENSAYCNSTKDLYISGGIKNDDLSYFWIINNEFFNIKKIKMNKEKLNHSMIYINHNNDEFIFIVGGNDLKTFYYDIKFNIFVDWGYMNYSHIHPSLIYVNDYLYCFDTSTKKGIIFERSNLNHINKKWEKIRPDFQNVKARNFTNFGFGANYCMGGKIMLCGGDSVNLNTYFYNIENNLLSENVKCEDVLFSFNDKNFYRIDTNNSIALPYSIDEEKEILVINNYNYSLEKIILNNNKKKKEEKNKKDKNKIDYNKYLKNLSIGNVNIELKTEDIKEEDINTEMDYQIENIVDTDNQDNISYLEKKSVKSYIIKNDINKDIIISKNMNDIKSFYIPNNDNYKNYKRINIEKNKKNENIINIPRDKFDDFDNEDNNIEKEIKLNFNEEDNFYEAEGNNFIYDSNSCKFNDIKANNDIFINKNLKVEKYIIKDFNREKGNNLNNKKNDKNLSIKNNQTKEEKLNKNWGDKISDINNKNNNNLEDNVKNSSEDGAFFEDESKDNNEQNEKEENDENKCFNENKNNLDEERKELNEINIEGNDDNNEDVEEYKDEMDLEEKDKNSYEDNDNIREENNENNNEEKEVDIFKDRDRFQQIIIEPINKDIIQIEHYPLLFYYKENNFCDYFYKQEEIKF